MIDNFDKILEFLPSKQINDLIYHLMVLKRKKDHPDLTDKSQFTRALITLSIKDKSDLLKYKEDIINIAESTRARIMINLSPKSSRKLHFSMLKSLTVMLENDTSQKLQGLFHSCVGSLEPVKQFKMFLIDWDEKDTTKLDEFINLHLKDSFKFSLPTKSGYHYLMDPFDTRQIKKELNIEVHKNNPTVVYIPKSLDN